MTTRFPSRRIYLPIFLAGLLAGLLAAAGCGQKDRQLTLEDLSGAEFVFVERMVVLERAKTAALMDREAGDALLDSLAAAWGDSSLQRTLAGAPDEPRRAEAVAALLRRVLAAEQDSLKADPGRDRLALPLPAPAPEVPEAEKAPEAAAQAGPGGGDGD